ncbi:hypothetical protein SAMN05216174_102421 [Actinokineospora iranica]|uniref:Uncharacterized protein n=1 Tax=Actinokineospora iranica TaxID=1271860 RepID=A0A1G6M8F6_9PSEU|nr:hypothetical protein SAMN05216174_102421 [Actinokineospora iranica]
MAEHPHSEQARRPPPAAGMTGANHADTADRLRDHKQAANHGDDHRRPR